MVMYCRTKMEVPDGGVKRGAGVKVDSWRFLEGWREEEGEREEATRVHILRKQVWKAAGVGVGGVSGKPSE
jgi:hypothetical protein